MKKGEKAILTCKAPYAYGKAGSPPKIPPDATLNFEVSLQYPRACENFLKRALYTFVAMHRLLCRAVVHLLECPRCFTNHCRMSKRLHA